MATTNEDPAMVKYLLDAGVNFQVSNELSNFLFSLIVLKQRQTSEVKIMSIWPFSAAFFSKWVKSSPHLSRSHVSATSSPRLTNSRAGFEKSSEMTWTPAAWKPWKLNAFERTSPLQDWCPDPGEGCHQENNKLCGRCWDKKHFWSHVASPRSLSWWPGQGNPLLGRVPTLFCRLSWPGGELQTDTCKVCQKFCKRFADMCTTFARSCTYLQIRGK